MEQSDIGLVGLGVMGQNFALNICDKDFRVSVFNRTTSKVTAFIENHGGDYSDGRLQGFLSLEEFIGSLKRPRRIILIVKAGPAVDSFIQMFLPHLEEGDIIIDGGNSYFKDTQRRFTELQDKHIGYMGMGISGGEEGARKGPSLMPGGTKAGWDATSKIFQAAAAKTEKGEPCCSYMGNDGAGHFVKMVHNGIEYGDMQNIAEGYAFLKQVYDLSNEKIADIFEDFSHTTFIKGSRESELSSYLMDITVQILRVKDPETQNDLVDMIRDRAGNKGTGKWTSQEALDLAVPVSVITEGLFARYISAFDELRQQGSSIFETAKAKPVMKLQDALPLLAQTLLFSKIMSYTQGFWMLSAAAKEYSWDLHLGEIALSWRAGCIIRSVFLDHIKNAYAKNPDLPLILFDDYFTPQVKVSVPAVRKILAAGIEAQIPMPGTSSALSFFDSVKSANLPANLIQAQRDLFGAHTFERTDRPRGEFVHFEWLKHVK